MNYYKIQKGSTKRIRIDEKDRWVIARPFVVEIILLIVDYVLKKDEEHNI